MKGLPFFGLPLWVLCLLNIKEDSLYFSKIVFYEQLLWRSLSIIWVYLLIPAIKDNNTQNCWQALIIIYIYDLLNEYDYFFNRGPFFKLTRAKKNQVVNPCQLFFTFMEVFSMKFSNAHLLKNNVHVSLYLFF